MTAGSASALLAIDVLLESDETMVARAVAANAELRSNYPAGFALDAAHVPHITLAQRFVRTDSLDKVYQAIGRVAAQSEFAAWALEAPRYYYLPHGEVGFAGIVVERTGELLRLQQDVIDALAPFATSGGTAAAFVRTAEDPEITQATIDYVERFMLVSSGDNFNPHVTIGMAKRDYLDELLARPFDRFRFSTPRLAVYQLGNFGTAQRLLKRFEGDGG